MVLLPVLVSVLPPLLLRAVLFSYGATVLSVVPDAVVPDASLRILVDTQQSEASPGGSDPVATAER